MEILVDIDNLLNSEVGTTETENIAIKEEFIDEDLRIKDSKGKVELTNLGNRILSQNDIESGIVLQCDRCLKEFIYPIKLSYAQEYSDERSQEYGNERETEVLPINANKTIDLWFSIRQEIILELPIKALCNEKCRGIQYPNRCVLSSE